MGKSFGEPIPDPPETEADESPKLDTEAISESLSEAVRESVEQATQQVIQALLTQNEVAREEEAERGGEGAPTEQDGQRDDGQSDMQGQLDKLSEGIDRLTGIQDQMLALLSSWE